MRSAWRTWSSVTVQFVPSPTTTKRGSERLRARSTLSPSLIWRQPRTSTSKPRARSESKAPEHDRVADRQRRWPEGRVRRREPVHRAAAGSLRGRSEHERGCEQPLRSRPVRSGFPLLRVRILLPGRARPLLGADAVSARLEAVHPRSELRVLRGGEPTLCASPRRRHARQPGRRGARRAQRGRATPAADHGSHGRRRPGCPRAVQVLRLLRRGDRVVPGFARARHAPAAAHARAADRAVASSPSRRSRTWST